jgi:uncharacterized membrane protein
MVMSRWFYLAIVLTLVAFAASGYVYFFQFADLPERIPTHWNVRGEADAWVSKENVGPTMLFVPIGMLVLSVLMLVLPRVSPRRFEVSRFSVTFEMLMAILVGMALYLHVVMLIAGLNMLAASVVGRVLLGGIIAFFGLIGLLLPKVQRNFWMGIRTPWTLASDRVWQATHCVAAWCFTAGAVAGLLLVVMGAPLEWCLGGLLGVVVIPVVYSLIYYKWLERHGRLDWP